LVDYVQADGARSIGREGQWKFGEGKGPTEVREGPDNSSMFGWKILLTKPIEGDL